MQRERQYGDVTYSLGPSSQPVSLENKRVSNERVDLDSNGYKAVFDRRYPSITDPEASRLRCSIMLVWEALLTRLPAQAYLLLIIHQQIYAALEGENGTLVNATLGKQTYMITVAKGQMQIFVFFTLLIFIWCVMG